MPQDPAANPPLADAESSDAPILSQQLRAHRLKILATYVVLGIESVLDLLYPLLIGIAINGLLVGDIYALVPLAAVWLIHILIGAARQLYDTRLFSRIFTAIAADLAQQKGANDVRLSHVSAHLDMAEEVVEFFEFDVPAIATALVALLGAMGLMFFYDAIAGVIVVCLIIPAFIIFTWLARRSFRLNGVLNNQHERQVQTVASGLTSRIGLHFSRVRKMRVALSNAEAFAWSGMEVITLLATLAVIAQLASVPGASAGSIFAGTAYMLRIIAELDRVPELIQRGALLLDIRRRLNRRG